MAAIAVWQLSIEPQTNEWNILKFVPCLLRGRLMRTSRDPCVEKAYQKKIAYDRTMIVYKLLVYISLYAFPNHKAPVESSCMGS